MKRSQTAFLKEACVSKAINFLSNIYSDKTIVSILESAINRRFEIHFLNRLTGVPQSLTTVQLAGIKKFGGVNILLETGQTYQIGLEMDQNRKGTYQEIYFADLIVGEKTLAQIKKEF